VSALIGIVGHMGAGKNAVADAITRLGSVGQYAQMSFAAPIKRICQEVYAFSDAQVYGSIEHKNAPDPRYPRPDGTFLTAREAMQTLGTEWARKCYPETWITMAMRQASDLRSQNYGVVFTDCRFINEAAAIRRAGGQVWRVYRPFADNVIYTHASETEMDGWDFRALVTHSIHNDGTLEQLASKVQTLMVLK